MGGMGGVVGRVRGWRELNFDTGLVGRAAPQYIDAGKKNDRG